MKKLIRKYLKLVKRIPERHYWPLFVVPYSEFVVTLGALGYFKFEKAYRRFFAKVISPLPDVIKYGGSIIFFLVMLDDTIFYAAIILGALWSNREAKKLKED
jgi:multisubunit Na+/H+ antiporter MnhG subunit